jgi:hypothetical protein
MSLHHSPGAEIDRKILQAAATAIRSIETVTGTIVAYNIGKDDALLLTTAMRNLWSVLESNGYTIDTDSNRLRRVDPTPSTEDIAITRRLKEAGEIMGIKLLDHIIVGDGEYLSLMRSQKFTQSLIQNRRAYNFQGGFRRKSPSVAALFC